MQRQAGRQLRDKVLSIFLSRRLSPIAKEFHVTTTQIFAICKILLECHDLNMPTNRLYINFKSAHYTIDREKLLSIMYEYGSLEKLTRLVKATMNRVMCSACVSGTLSSSFESGTLEGVNLKSKDRRELMKLTL